MKDVLNDLQVKMVEPLYQMSLTKNNNVKEGDMTMNTQHKILN
jgi:hypothetical protein